MQKNYCTPNELRIFAELAEIKLLLTGKIASHQSKSDASNSIVRTPKFVCEKYDISRGTLDRYFALGLLTKISLSPESSKVYIAESELLKFFNSSKK